MNYLDVILILVAVYVPVLIVVWKYQNSLDKPYQSEESHETAINCAFCPGKLTKVMDFGWVALAGGFLKPDQFEKEATYPLRLCFCESCYAVQLADRVSPDVMFKDYFYFSSATGTIKQHFREYSKEVVERFNPKTVVEIGCNDGVLIDPLREAGVNAIGVDPSSTVPKASYIINEYFTDEVANRIGEVDMVIANNVFAHINDIRSATCAVVKALKPDGVFVMEVHYLGDMLDGLQYDWIYHEHIYYYSLLSLEKHFHNYGLCIFDVKPVKTHGGSMRYYVCKYGTRQQTENVTRLRGRELLQGLHKLETYTDFAKRIKQHREDLRKTLEGKRVVGYGASGRANALIQYCGLNIEYIVDDAPAKHGYYTPGSHIPIVKTFDGNPSVIVFAWTYADEIQRKCDLPMIVPLPEIRQLEKRKAA